MQLSLFIVISLIEVFEREKTHLKRDQQTTFLALFAKTCFSSLMKIFFEELFLYSLISHLILFHFTITASRET